MMGTLSYRRILAVLKKEFIQLIRDRGTLRIMVLIPIMQLLLFGFAINTDPKNLPTAFLSADKGIMARNILSGLENSGYFAFTNPITSEQEGTKLLQQGKVNFAIIIPENFTRDFIRGNNPNLLIEADATDPVAIAGALGAADFAIRQAIQRDTKTVLNTTSLAQPTYELRIHKLYNPEGLSRYNIIPGLIATVLTMTCLTMTALSLTRERERGTMENLLSMPVKPIEVMIGKIAPYIMIAYFQAAIILTTAYFLFNVPILGNLGLLMFGLLIFIMCNLALGFTVSTAAKSQMQAMQLSTFIFLPSLLLSGFMFPFRGMPDWAQWIGSILPNTYFIRIVRGIMLKGTTFDEILPNIWPLCIFMIVVTAIATKAYRKTLD